MSDRPRILVLLECPAELRQSLGRLVKHLGRRYQVRVLDYAETELDRLAELVKFAKERKSEIAPDREKP